MNSIRTFLIVVLISTITLISFITALHGYRESLKQSKHLFEDHLQQQASILNSVFTINDNLNLKQSQKEIHNAYQIFDENKTLLVRTDNSPETAIAEFSNGFYESNFSGYRWHVYVMHTNKNWILVAERDDMRQKLAESIIMEAVFPIIITIPLTGILVWFILGIGLRPIHNLALQLRSKEETDLTPIQIENTPMELKAMAISANDLLRRLENSFNREKRFNSDVAHELRTPIAALKIHLENLMANMQSPDDTAIKLDAGVKRMSYLVEQMILLNRMIPDHYLAQFSNLVLNDVIRTVISELLDEINTKNQTIEFNGNHCTIYGDQFAIETLFKNILRNAIKYTPENGRLHIRISEDVNNTILQVIDNGPGIPESEYDRVFERFYRIGGDRHPANIKGCGLGLSIVKYIAELHDATITLGKSEYETGLMFSVSFPKTFYLNGKSTNE